MFDYGICDGQVYVDGSFQKSNLYIKDEKIAALSTELLECKKIMHADGNYVLPGFIDPHVHFSLGVGENMSKDDFYTGSLEAVRGGVTTYIDFLDPVKKAEEIPAEFEKRNNLAKDSVVDYAFHMTVANPVSSAAELIKESKKLGINSIKLFTTYADTDRRTYDDKIYELLKASKEENALIVVHSENDDLIDKRKDILVKDHEKARPAITENIEVMKLAQMARETGGTLYIVHVSAGSSAKLLADNFPEELKRKQILLESCPHYFLLNSDALSREDGYKYTMTPPIRPEQERKLLNKYLDVIRTIGTDHCPYTRKQKEKSYTSQVPMGIGGIRYSFLNMYNLVGFSILDKFTKEPAQIYGLKTKGTLLPGQDADIVIFDSRKQTVVTDDMSVYANKTLQGSIETVFARGCKIFDGQTVNVHKGNYLKRGTD